MESNTFMMPIDGKSILRSTGEEVEIIDSQTKERGARSDEDWVTYIDSQGKEHIREHLNMQLDFKPIQNDLFNKMLDIAKPNYPTERNRRIFDVAKELYINSDRGYSLDEAVQVATNLVDKINIDN